jgi:hypothetical protein
MPLNPWRSIWTRPRATIQQILETQPERYVVLLAAVGGIFQSLDQASFREHGDQLPWPTILTASVVGGPIGGIITLYVFGFLVAWTGRWLGGVASPLYVRAAIGWYNWPAICIGLLWIPELALFGQEAFTSATPRIDADSGLSAARLLISVPKFVLGIWAIIILCMCVGQVQGFSAWRALGNLVLAVLAFFAPLVALILLISLLSASV